jgi:hypothetical protein
MDRRIMDLLVISLMLFSMCLGSKEPGEKAQDLRGTAATAPDPDATKALTTTTMFVLPTIYSETLTSVLLTEETILGEETTTRMATTTTISSSKGCSKCRNSDLSCGQTVKDNGTDIICTCIKPLSNGEYSSCYISRGTICAGCYDGTGCGQNNLKGALCRCDESVGEGVYLSCFLGKPKCTQCNDGTECGDVSASGKGCFCDPPCHDPGCGEWDNCELK